MLQNQGVPKIDASYLAPELSEDSFDAFAADLFSAGVILFQIVTGFAPFKRAKSSDLVFKLISRGHLPELIESWGFDVSAEAVDLLQNMLWRNPRDRFTLSQIMEHPWFTGGKLPSKAHSESAWKPCDLPDVYTDPRMDRLKREILSQDRRPMPTMNRKMRRSLVAELLRHQRNKKRVSFGEAQIYHFDSGDPDTSHSRCLHPVERTTILPREDFTQKKAKTCSSASPWSQLAKMLRCSSSKLKRLKTPVGIKIRPDTLKEVSAKTA